MTAVDRILEVLKDTGLSVRQFELSIGKTSGYLNSLVKRDSSPSVNVISKITDVYPQYSGEWIITGRGSMIHENQNNKAADQADLLINKMLDAKIEAKFNELRQELIQIIEGKKKL